MVTLKNTLSCLVFLFLLVNLVKSQTDSNYFAGNWNLNKTKTDIKSLPVEFKDYKVEVLQDNEKIVLKNYIEGLTEPRFDDKSSATLGSARPQDGIWGDARGNTNTGLTVKANYNGTMALSKYFHLNEAKYNLNGKEVEIDILQDGRKVGLAKVKAKLEKDGKSFKVVTIRRMKTMKAGQTEMIIYVREKWDLLDDNKTLKYIKTVEFPNAIDEVILYFNKA